MIIKANVFFPVAGKCTMYHCWRVEGMKAQGLNRAAQGLTVSHYLGAGASLEKYLKIYVPRNAFQTQLFMIYILSLQLVGLTLKNLYICS